jgi:predicted PurR-regulated permease PerM
MPTELPSLSIRQLVFGTLAVTAVVLCFWLLLQFYSVLLLLLAAIILSTGLKPAVNWLEARGLPKAAGILVIYGVVALGLVLLVWYSAPVLAEQGTAVRQSVDDGYQYLITELRHMPNILVRRLVASLPPDLSQLQFLPIDGETAVAVQTETPETPSQIQTQAARLLTNLLHLLAIFMLAFFWTLEGERLKQSALLLVPLNRREGMRELVQEAEARVSGYLLGQGLLVLLVGIFSFIAYLLIGLPNTLLLAVFAGIMEAIPFVGPFLGAIPAIIIGLSVSPMTALWVIIVTIIIQQIEGNLLVPRVMNRTVGVRPLVTILALLALGSLFGIIGALIALPLAAVVQLLLDRFLLSPESLAQEEPGRDRLSVLRYETNQLVQDVRHQVRQKEDEASAVSDQLEDEVEAIALDLESYLAVQGPRIT